MTTFSFLHVGSRRTGKLRLAGLFVWVALAFVPGQPSAQRPAEGAHVTVPVADFFRTPLIAKPALSPSGRYLAIAVTVKEGRVQLAVLDLENIGPPKVIAGFDDADVWSFHWVNDGRLVYDAIDLQSGDDRPLRPGLWAVNRDGSGHRQLIKSLQYFVTTASTRADRTLPWEWVFYGTLADGSNDILVEGLTFDNGWEVVATKLARLDTTTGITQSLSDSAPDHVSRWVVDRQGRPLVAMSWNRGRFRSYFRSGADAHWERWQDAEAYGGTYQVPYWVGFDGQMLALVRHKDGHLVLQALDAKTRRPEPEPLIVLEGYDFSGRMVVDTEARRLLGVHYEADAFGTIWMDPAMQAIQTAVNALLPGTVNRIDCERCTSVPRVLVSSGSDRQPSQYYVYDRDTKVLTLIAASRRWIKPQEMGRREMHRFAARDGLSIPVVVTHPAGKAAGARPAVVLVHGGPWVRGAHWQWAPEPQFLASRGYVVIEPDFRGSSGYGYKHFRAGWKQWGLAMQDDLADAVNWAAEKGWIDPRRVCIAGASYGGYAVLMGLVRDHDLYQCGIDWVGVSDIKLLYTIAWSDTSSDVKGYTMPLLIGDPVADAKQLKDTSPVEQAGKIRRPLLLAYGGADRRVPIEHGKELRDAVTRTNKDVEWVVYPDEGHGWRKLETKIDFWTRAERFLDRHIGTRAK